MFKTILVDENPYFPQLSVAEQNGLFVIAQWGKTRM